MRDIKLCASCGIIAPLGLERAFQVLGEAGYQGVEIPVARLLPPVETSRERRREIAEAAKRASLAIMGTHGALPSKGHRFTSPNAEERRRSLSYLQGVVDLTTDLGGRVVTVGAPAARNILPGESHEEAWAWAREVFSEAASHAERRGAVVGIEIVNRYETNIFVTMEEGVRMVKEVGLPALGITPDTYHMNIDEGPFHQAILESAPYIVHMHIGDTNRQSLGQGNLDFHQVVGALIDAGWQGYLSVELMQDYYGRPLREPAERALRLSRQYLEGVLLEEYARQGIEI